MRLALHVLTYGATWPDTLRTVQLAERVGYDDVLGADHLLASGGDPHMPFFEGWTTLAAWAAVTNRVRLGLLVGANPFRHPAVVAKIAATVDHISAGRLILGLGAAWNDQELGIHGLPVGSGIGERLEWLDEALEVISRLLAGETVTRDGPAYRLTGARHAPSPVQSHVPVLIGGEGEKRTMRIVARHADMWQMWVPAGSTERFSIKSALLDERCRQIGRDPASIGRLVGAKIVIRDDPADAHRFFEELVARHEWPNEVREHAWLGTPEWVAERVRRYEEAGATGLVAQVISPFDHQTIERLATEVVPRA